MCDCSRWRAPIQWGREKKIGITGKRHHHSNGAGNRVERIKTADGKTLYDSDVDKLVQAMASFDPPAATQTSWTDGQTSKGKVLLTVTH